MRKSQNLLFAILVVSLLGLANGQGDGENPALEIPSTTEATTTQEAATTPTTTTTTTSAAPTTTPNAVPTTSETTTTTTTSAPVTTSASTTTSAEANKEITSTSSQAIRSTTSSTSTTHRQTTTSAGASVTQAVGTITGGESIIGTWSSGSGSVLTGRAFGNPTLNNSFNYPSTAGWSFSFTKDGYFEQAQFTWTQSPVDHTCIEAIIIWQHGTFTQHSNGSITTDSSMFEADGRMQVQNECNLKPSIITYFSEPGLYKTWAVMTFKGKTTLQLSDAGGALLPRMFQVDTDPTKYMFPTQYLSNSTGEIIDQSE